MKERNISVQKHALKFLLASPMFSKAVSTQLCQALRDAHSRYIFRPQHEPGQEPCTGMPSSIPHLEDVSSTDPSASMPCGERVLVGIVIAHIIRTPSMKTPWGADTGPKAQWVRHPLLNQPTCRGTAPQHATGANASQQHSWISELTALGCR